MYVGALSVKCPLCGAVYGRPCSTRRGWLTQVHHQRRAAWLAEERAVAKRDEPATV